jgi:hypothetical protein
MYGTSLLRSTSYIQPGLIPFDTLRTEAGGGLYWNVANMYSTLIRMCCLHHNYGTVSFFQNLRCYTAMDCFIHSSSGMR